jgi:hypothetical protein
MKSPEVSVSDETSMNKSLQIANRKMSEIRATAQSYRVSPDAFVDVSAANYLGNPEVVNGLVGQFCVLAEEYADAIRDGIMDPKDAAGSLREDIVKMADIFSGRDPQYVIIKGYNDSSLQGKLKGDLLQYYVMHKDEYKGDSLSVFFDWLAAHVMEASAKAAGDDLILGATLKPTLKYAVEVLLGIEKRVNS